MVSNRELYEKVFCQYLEKGYDEDRADYVASKVVCKQRKHLHGQQSIINGGWAPGNLDLAPLINDGGYINEFGPFATFRAPKDDKKQSDLSEYNPRDDEPRCVREQMKRRR